MSNTGSPFVLVKEHKDFGKDLARKLSDVLVKSTRGGKGIKINH